MHRWRHRPGCPPPGLIHIARRAHSLHRRIFVWFGVSILLTFCAVGMVGRHVSHNFNRTVRGVGQFSAARFAEVWDAPAERERLARELADALAAPVSLWDERGQQIIDTGGRCNGETHRLAIIRGGEQVGELGACVTMGGSKRLILVALAIAALMLWAASGVIARRLVWPLAQVARVARDIGSGQLSSRVRLRRHAPGEIGELADAINEMAERIEKQMADQRALVAAVSHELRTPLAHMRVITELAQNGERERLAELEREIGDVDNLVDQLLASSRLEFDTMDHRALDAVDVCVRALERTDLDASLLEVEADDTSFEGDAMLISRALGNLLENAQRHADGLASLRVTGNGDRLTFTVTDRGPGLDPAELDKVFDSFYRGERRAKATAGSLGLGLALVRRIAEAHGGRAWARNVDGGAEVGFDVARR